MIFLITNNEDKMKIFFVLTALIIVFSTNFSFAADMVTLTHWFHWYATMLMWMLFINETDKLGRQFGCKNKKHILDGKEKEISSLIEQGVTKTRIAKIMGVSSKTIYKFVNSMGCWNYLFNRSKIAVNINIKSMCKYRKI